MIGEFLAKFFGYHKIIVTSTDAELIASLPHCLTVWMKEKMDGEEAAVRLWVYSLLKFMYERGEGEMYEVNENLWESLGSYYVHISRLEHILASYFGTKDVAKMNKHLDTVPMLVRN